MTTRRDFLQACLAASVAPAFVGSKVLMPVRTLIVPEETLTYFEVPITIEQFFYGGAPGGGKSDWSRMSPAVKRYWKKVNWA